MKLKKFQVTDFRSVEDSSWIETDDVTALIGTNESGKTNILLPLWKLNPAKEGAIVPTADYPRKHFVTYRHKTPKPVFIRALFDVEEALARELSIKAGAPADQFVEVLVSRRLDGEYEIEFPKAAAPPRSVAKDRVLTPLKAAERELKAMTPGEGEEELKKQCVLAVQTARESVPQSEVDAEGLNKVAASLRVKSESTSGLVQRHQRAVEEVEALLAEVSRPHPNEVDAAADFVLEHLPKFVYYSTYGNLDSEIYLPHVMANLKRKDIGQKEQAKARTLKVLFEFVKLKPDEILELGRDFKDARQPTADEIAAIAEKKKQRSILLQSASTLLTTEFRSWWKQGEYRFRFEADGDHFRIWVSDDKRPEEVELEGRSTGLQWFLSFYLVFLVERADAHEGALLLLDEPGMSLHPLAQRDLSEFFDGLAKDNQLLYTSHSPFLIDADRLDRVRKVYVGDNGTSIVTPDLRAGADTATQKGSAYAVHAALGLSVAESLLIGCEPVVVEGPSDQHYLTAIKNLLIAAGRLKPGRELVFPPAGGAKGVKAVASILSSREEQLPVALFDSDAAGRATIKALRESLYAGNKGLVLEIGTFVDGLADAEVEDLIPPSIVVGELDRWQRGSAVPFADEVKAGTSIVAQIEAWAPKHGVMLAAPGWKVELAKRVKQKLLAGGPGAIDPAVLDRWVKLFEAFRDAGLAR